MRLEQRGRVKRLYSAFNWQQEETVEYNKTVSHLQAMWCTRPLKLSKPMRELREWTSSRLRTLKRT